MELSKLTTEQQREVFKVALFLGLSVAIDAVISAIAQNPDLFGKLTAPVNFLLVLGKKLLTKE